MPLCTLFSKRPFVNCFRNAPLYTVFETPLCTLFSKRHLVHCFQNDPLYTVFETPLCKLFSKRPFVHCSQLRPFIHCSQLQGRLLVRNQLHKNILNYAQFRLRRLPNIFYGTSLQKYLTAIIVKHFYQKTPSQVFYIVFNSPLTKMVIIKASKFRYRICWEWQHPIFSH